MRDGTNINPNEGLIELAISKITDEMSRINRQIIEKNSEVAHLNLSLRKCMRDIAELEENLRIEREKTNLNHNVLR